MTPGSEIDPQRDIVVPARSAGSATVKRHWTRRRGIAGFFAAFGVVAMAGAVLAPTGMALAEQPQADVETAFSMAVEDTQDLTVTVAGATIAPVERSGFEVYVKPKPKPKPKPQPASDSNSGGQQQAATPFYTGGGAPAEWMAAAGIAAGDWGYVDYIVSRESGWNPNATNSSSGACGLVQALPCSKVPGNGYDPVDNLRWANGYATGRYGSWAAAHSFWVNNHWW